MNLQLQMNQACFRFYEELNDFLPAVKRKTTFSWTFSGNPSVKFAIETLGVPHAEVDLILVNGRSVDFSYRLRNGDPVSVYPVFESMDISPVTRLRERPLRDPKFIADAHLGKLARYLRLCGFNTLFRNDFHDREIIDTALTEKRTILTRDRELLKNKSVTHGYWIRSQKPREQLEEVRSFLLPKTVQHYQDFWKCNACGRIYWKGSHYNRMKELVDEINEK